MDLLGCRAKGERLARVGKAEYERKVVGKNEERVGEGEGEEGRMGWRSYSRREYRARHTPPLHPHPT